MGIMMEKVASDTDVSVYFQVFIKWKCVFQQQCNTNSKSIETKDRKNN